RNVVPVVVEKIGFDDGFSIGRLHAVAGAIRSTSVASLVVTVVMSVLVMDANGMDTPSTHANARPSEDFVIVDFDIPLDDGHVVARILFGIFAMAIADVDSDRIRRGNRVAAGPVDLRARALEAKACNPHVRTDDDEHAVQG